MHLRRMRRSNAFDRWLRHMFSKWLGSTSNRRDCQRWPKRRLGMQPLRWLKCTTNYGRLKKKSRPWNHCLHLGGRGGSQLLRQCSFKMSCTRIGRKLIALSNCWRTKVSQLALRSSLGSLPWLSISKVGRLKRLCTIQWVAAWRPIPRLNQDIWQWLCINQAGNLMQGRHCATRAQWMWETF